MFPAVILSFAVTTGVVAQLSGPLSDGETPIRVTLDLHDAEISTVLELIAKQSGMNLVIASDVRGKVSARLNDVPWRDALEAIVRTSGYSWIEDRIGSSAFIRVRNEPSPPIVAATSKNNSGRLEVVHGTIVEPVPFLPELFPVDKPSTPLDVPVRRNRAKTQSSNERTLALALLEYLQEPVLTTPLPTSS